MILLHLLDQIVHDAALASVTADGAYDIKACHAAIAERGAAAVTPPPCKRMRESARGRAGASGRSVAATYWRGLAGGDQDALLQAPGRASDGWHAPLSASSLSYMCESRCSSVAARSLVLRPSLWHESVWGYGVENSICAKKPHCSLNTSCH